jgi:hypothetical protein
MVYQGRLTDLTGAPITDQQQVIFAIYSSPSSQLVRWAETLFVSPDVQGVFTVELGTVHPLDETVFTGDRRYLGLTVGTDGEMEPRQLLSSTPYAVSAKNIPDGSVDVNKLADSSVTNVKLSQGAVTSPAVLDNSLTGDDLQDEPGLAFRLSLPSNTFREIPAGTTPLDSVLISAPGPGYIYVWAHTDVGVDHVEGTMDQMLFQVAPLSDTVIPNNFGFAMVLVPAELPTQAANSFYVYPVDAHRAFQIGAGGDYTYYFNAKISSGDGNSDRFFNLQMTAFYFPTAYGDVDQVPDLKAGEEKTSRDEKQKEEGSD